MDAGRFFGDIRLDAHHDLVAPGGRELALEGRCVETDGEPWTLL